MILDSKSYQEMVERLEDVEDRQMLEELRARVRGGSVVVFHANGKGRHTRAVVEELSQELLKKGLQPVTVSELLGRCNASGTMIPSSATVRPYKPDDFAAVVRLLADLDPLKRLNYSASDWERLFGTSLQGREAFVIETGGSVVGVGVLRQRFLFGDYLELFAIAALAHGRGYGRALLAHLESVVFRRAKNLFVCVSDFNHQARRFYERNGYTEIGPILHLLIPGSSEILLRNTTGPAKSV